jgi:hypothetical protein
MNSETVRNILQMLTAMITAATAVFAVIVAKKGLDTWHRQMLGQADHALARRILLAAYTVRGAFRSARSPMMTGGELAAAAAKRGIEKFDHLNPEHSKVATETAYWTRFWEVADAWNKLHVELIEAEAIWAERKVPGSEELRIKIVDLEVALMEYLDKDTQQGGPEYAERMKSLRSVIVSKGSIDSPDEFMAAVNKAIETMEGCVRPRLGQPVLAVRTTQGT